MLVDITYKLTKDLLTAPQARIGHLGTHFDCMNKQFPFEYFRSNGYIFDVSHIENREIGLNDIDITKVENDMFVGFWTGLLDKYDYLSQEYIDNETVLSYELINALLEKKVRMIGVDFKGIRKSKEHTPADQLCADHNAFVIENLCNMKEVTNQKITVHVYPLSIANISGLPCRVIAEKE